MSESKVEVSKASRRAFILFPQSTLGRFLFYSVFVFQVVMYVFHAFTLPDGTHTSNPHIRTLIGMLGDIVFGVGANLIVLWIIRWFLVKFGALKLSGLYRTQFKSFFASIAGATIVLMLVIPIVVDSNLSSQLSTAPATAGVDVLSSEEKFRFQEILTGVIQQTAHLTPEVHHEFWMLMKKMGVREKNEVEQIWDLMTGISNKYQRYLWEDAYQAFQQGRPFKSLERENYEKYLKEVGVFSDFRIEENEEFIRKVALKYPMPIQGQNIVITETIIQQTLSTLEKTTTQLDKLFTP